MLHTLTANWWALALRGLVAVLFGLLTFFLPGITLVTLVLLFGAYALADGVFNVIAFFRVASHQWALLIEGVVGIIAGVVTFAWPAITAMALLYLIAFWAILTGIFEIVAGIRLRKTIANEWLLIADGCSLPTIRFADSVCSWYRGTGDRVVDRSLRVGIRHLSVGPGIPPERAPPTHRSADIGAAQKLQQIRVKARSDATA